MDNPKTEWEITIRGEKMLYRVGRDTTLTEYAVLLESYSAQDKMWSPLFTFDNEEQAVEYLTTFKEKFEGVLKTTGKKNPDLINNTKSNSE